MKIITEEDYVGEIQHPQLSKQLKVLRYYQGGISIIPHDFFRDWLNEEPSFGTFHIGKCSGFGVGSMVKYDSDAQCLRIGRFVEGGWQLRFILNAQHETRTISTATLGVRGADLALQYPEPPQYGDSIIKNDVWMGDEVMMLGGGIIENGCIIGARSLLPPNFRSEPYGIYAGSPARLIRFRFPEKIREALLDLAWWEMPLSWVRNHNSGFLVNLINDEAHSLEMLAALKERKHLSFA